MNIAVDSGVTGTPILTLVPNEIATITFAELMPRVTVIRLAAVDADVWWTTDGTDPDPNTGNGWLVPKGGVGIEERNTIWTAIDDKPQHRRIKLVSAEPVQVRVYRGDA